jgi:SAM-dependent methyltransferase
VSSPDGIAAGLIAEAVDPLRYGKLLEDPFEPPGIMRRMMPSGVRVLDVGCGAGGGTVVMNAGKHNEVLALEPDPQRAEAARSRGLNVRQTAFDVEALAELGAFDVVVLADVLEHQADPAVMLGLVRQCLAPQGRVLISVPNVAHWTVRLGLLFGRFDYRDSGIMDATHLRWFTERSLLAFVRRCGFEAVEVDHSSGSWMAAYRIVPKFLRRSLVRGLVGVSPGLFGCQHVVSATMN